MQTSEFKLSKAASDLFDRNMTAIREGIVNISQLRKRDKGSHSLSKLDFEKAYIEKLLGSVVSAVAADIRGLADVLTKQAEAEAEELAEKFGYTTGEQGKIAAIHKGTKIIPEREYKGDKK